MRLRNFDQDKENEKKVEEKGKAGVDADGLVVTEGGMGEVTSD
jgi:hypothetical protein